MNNAINKINSIKLNIQRNQNISLYLVSVFVIIGYLFFFMSPYILPGHINVAATELMKTITCQDGNTIRIIRSDYSKQQNKIQFEFEVSESLLRPYEFTVVVRNSSGKNTRHEIVPIMREQQIYVLNIENVSDKWRELQIEVIGMQNSEMAVMTKIYSNINSIKVHDNIPDKTITEYKIDRTNLYISEYRQQIEQLETDNNAKWYEIGLLKELNANLEEQKKYQTDEEIKSTNVSIQSNVNKINNYAKEIIKTEEMISEYKKKIQKSNELIMELS